jgi:hypothetical protein
MIRELNWNSRVKDASLLRHWRVSACAAAGAFIAIAVWHALFPHCFWFIKLWAGVVTGSFVGTVAGTIWQLWNPERRLKTSGRFLVASVVSGAVFATVSICMLLPDFQAQESERAKIRSLVANDITSISVSVLRDSSYVVENGNAIASFVNLARDAELFFPSHESSKTELQLVIHFKNGAAIGYKGRIPERHPSDLALEFRGYFALDEIIVPGGAGWLGDSKNGS